MKVSELYILEVISKRVDAGQMPVGRIEIPPQEHRPTLSVVEDINPQSERDCENHYGYIFEIAPDISNASV